MNILYATDGSESALAGAAFLAQLPLDKSSKIRLLSVAPKEDEEATSEAQRALDEAHLILSDSGARFARYLRLGHAAEEILHEAAEHSTDLIVVGTKGRSAIARFFLGSVAEWVARHAHCSVLVTRPSSNPPQTILVGLDGSAGAEQAVRFLSSLPLPPGCRIHLVSVVFPEAVVNSSRHMLLPKLSDEVWELSQQERVAAQDRLEEASKGLSASAIGASAMTTATTVTTVTTEVRTGGAAIELLAAAEEIGADLVVVGAQGLSALDRFLIGSVSERLLRHAPCSVLCVRSEKCGNEE
jgi:nucleotide-binding universal stress UspA family protein